MIPPRHTRFHSWFISQYTRIGLKRHFSRVVVHGGFVEKGHSVLVVGNHFSWWDGFFVYYLNEHHFHRKFHVMMLEEQLKKNMILNRVGAFSVQKNSRSMVESLQFARQILEEGPQNLLLYYPQGEIQSVYQKPVSFQKGLEKIVTGQEDRISIWMVVNLPDYFSNKKPELHMYLKEFMIRVPFKIADLEQAFNEFLDASMKNQHPEA